LNKLKLKKKAMKTGNLQLKNGLFLNQSLTKQLRKVMYSVWTNSEKMKSILKTKLTTPFKQFKTILIDGKISSDRI